MVSSLLKGLALTIGSVALGIGIKIGKGRSVVREPLYSRPDDGSTRTLVLDRLQLVESRIGRVESALAEWPRSAQMFRYAGTNESLHHAPGRFESRFSSQVSEMINRGDDLQAIHERSSGSVTQFGMPADQLNYRLSSLVEQIVGTCFQQMEQEPEREIEETHTRAFDIFFDNIQTKVVQRISVFKRDLAGQADATNQLQEYFLNTDQKVQRLLVELNRLASEIARAAETESANSSSSHR